MVATPVSFPRHRTRETCSRLLSAWTPHSLGDAGARVQQPHTPVQSLLTSRNAPFGLNRTWPTGLGGRARRTTSAEATRNPKPISVTRFSSQASFVISLSRLGARPRARGSSADTTPVATLHSRTSPSYEPEHTTVPSGECQAHGGNGVGRREARSCTCLASAAHSRTVSSTEPVTNTFLRAQVQGAPTCAVCPENTRRHSPNTPPPLFFLRLPGRGRVVFVIYT